MTYAVVALLAYAAGIATDRALLAERWRRARMQERFWNESVRLIALQQH